jgi:uncharacterized protein
VADTAVVKNATLSLTHQCNLRCTYCYAGDKVNRPMSEKTANQALDFLAQHSDGHCTVTFFGGEPLLEFDLMKKVVDYARSDHDGRFDFRMSTNGVLLTAEKMAFLRQHEIYFVLSIDGCEQQHNCTRTYPNGKGSFASVARHLPAVFEFNPYTIAVSVITPETVGYVSEGVQDLFARGFRYVLQTLDHAAPWTSNDLRKLKDQYRKLADYYYKMLKNDRKIYYSPFDERIKTWAQKPYQPGDLCDLGNSQVSIAPSGRIYPCVQFVAGDDEAVADWVIGDIVHGFNDQRRRWLRTLSLKRKAECDGCALEGRCATHCGCVNWQATGHIDRVPPVICKHERVLMPIVDRLANRLYKKKVSLFERKFYDRLYPMSSYVEDCKVVQRES